MIAPMRRADSVVAATTSSSIVSSSLGDALEVAEERRAAEVRQRAADVGLKQHDDREDDVGGEVADHPVDGLELEPLREEEQADEEAAAQRHLHRARAADEQQQLVDQDRDERDVEQIPPGDGGPAAEQFGEPVHHQTSR